MKIKEIYLKKQEGGGIFLTKKRMIKFIFRLPLRLPKRDFRDSVRERERERERGAEGNEGGKEREREIEPLQMGTFFFIFLSFCPGKVDTVFPLTLGRAGFNK